MAYLPYEDEEDALGGAGLSQGANTGGPTQVYNPSGPSRFTNFAQYFNANNGQAAGDSLVAGLEAPAAAAHSGLTSAKNETVSAAQAGTARGPTPLPSGPMSTAPVPRTGLGTPSQVAASHVGATYTGPTMEATAARFDPLQQGATRAAQNINTARDAAGVRAIRGGTGFQATLAHAGAGGRLSDLRKKYGGLAGEAGDMYGAATGAVTGGKTASEQASKDWKTRSDVLAAREAPPAEAPPTDEIARWQRVQGGYWVENPGYSPRFGETRKPMPKGYREFVTSTGVKAYG